jgi:DNA-binding response OmpR family regulator
MRRVLLVPDRVMEGELGSSYLDRGSLCVRTAHDADEALRMALVFKPELVVLRRNLIAGARRLCTELRALTPPSLILLVTEFIGDDEPEVFDELCDARLVQPVEAPQLLATVAALLDIRTRRGSRVPLETLVHVSGFGLANAQGTCIANAIDLSEHGMLLEASEQLGLGDSGTVTFFLPEDDRRVVARGTVSVAMDEVLLHYAVEFDDLEPSVRDSVQRFVARQAMGVGD